MSNSVINSTLQVRKFLADFFQEYIRNNRFSRYIGTDNNAVIVIKEGRQIINIPLITRLKNAGVSGSSTLDGNEELVSNYSMDLTPTYRRNAVRLTKEEEEKPAFSLMKAARPLLMDWSKELVRDDVIAAMGAAIPSSTGYAKYSVATATELDNWNTGNQDRILYGASKSNNTSGNHTTSLSAIDTTNDKLTPQIISLAKRMAKQADPHIRPLRVKEDEEWYVMFCDPYAFRDLKENSTMAQANREARERSEGNPLFTDGDLLWDGVIIREIPEIADFIDGTSGSNGIWGGSAVADGLNTAGASSTRVAANFLCGQQAVGYGLGQKPDMKVDEIKDYGFQPGVAVEMKHEIRKANFNGKQHGMVTVFTSAARDA